MRIVITIFAEHAWVLESHSVDVHVGARAGLARERSDVRGTPSWRSPHDWTYGDVASVAARDAANAIAHT
jgi:hypothetical protein